jgi:hypothetical protein
MVTTFHAKYFSFELMKRGASDNIRKLVVTLSDAQISLNVESIRSEPWKTFDEARRGLDRRKDALLNMISRCLEQRLEEKSLMASCWRIA